MMTFGRIYDALYKARLNKYSNCQLLVAEPREKGEMMPYVHILVITDKPFKNLEINKFLKAISINQPISYYGGNVQFIINGKKYKLSFKDNLKALKNFGI